MSGNPPGGRLSTYSTKDSGMAAAVELSVGGRAVIRAADGAACAATPIAIRARLGGVVRAPGDLADLTVLWTVTGEGAGTGSAARLRGRAGSSIHSDLRGSHTPLGGPHTGVLLVIGDSRSPDES